MDLSFELCCAICRKAAQCDRLGQRSCPYPHPGSLSLQFPDFVLVLSPQDGTRTR